MLEAVKRAGGDPPVLEGAGYNGVYTALAGYYYAQRAPSPARRQPEDAPVGGLLPRPSGYFQPGELSLKLYFNEPAWRIDEKTVNSAGFFPGKWILGLHNRRSSAIIGKCVKSMPPVPPAGGKICN